MMKFKIPYYHKPPVRAFDVDSVWSSVMSKLGKPCVGAHWTSPERFGGLAYPFGTSALTNC